MGDEAVYLGILMKIIAITYIAEFGASICRDSGYSAIGNQVEFWKNNDSFGKYADNYNIVGDYQQYYEKVEEGYVR